MKRFMLFLLALLSFAALAFSVTAQDGPGGPSAPTLVPPTPVPTIEAGDAEIILTRSAVGTIQERGRVRIGILYNEPPFGELTLRGEVVGYDAGLARAMAELWGIEPVLRQVTRQTGMDMLREGRVDMLIASQVHRRELDDEFEFSHTYHLGRQTVMVRADDPAQSLSDLTGRRVGVVLGTPAQAALDAWRARSGIDLAVETYLTLDRLYGALMSGAVDGMAGSDHRLNRISSAQPEATRLLQESIELEPYAVLMRRQDLPLRNLVNRSLQYLQRSGRLGEIAESYFSEPYEALPIWENLGDSAPTPGQFTAEITYPSQYAVPRVRSEGVVRVAGIQGITRDDPNAQESDRRLDLFHRSLMDAMAARWGVTVEYIPSTAEEAIGLVAGGQADIAVNIKPDWTWAEQVDFTGAYLLRGLRLMVKSNSNILGFTDLAGGRTVAVTFEEPNADEIAVEEARQVNSLIDIFQTREGDLALQLLEDNNADVAFADSVRLIPHVQSYPNDLRLTEEWYSRTFVSMAVPRNDIDFRLLVEYTIQELYRDGTLQQLLAPVMLPEDIPAFDIWPGPSSYLGFQLGS